MTSSTQFLTLLYYSCNVTNDILAVKFRRSYHLVSSFCHVILGLPYRIVIDNHNPVNFTIIFHQNGYNLVANVPCFRRFCTITTDGLFI